jgi:hypothetical protein
VIGALPALAVQETVTAPLHEGAASKPVGVDGGSLAEPDNATVSVERLVAMDRLADCVPTEVGANVTETVQDPPATSELPQVSVSVKPTEGVMEIEPTASVAAPAGFESVTLRGAEVVPTS